MRAEYILILLTFFLLLITGVMDPASQEIAGAFLILSIGLIHGAHDMFLMKKMKEEKFSWLKIGGRYLLIAAFFGGLYLLAPLLLISIFVLFSAYHFGEQHWLAHLKGPRPTEIFFAFSYGLAVIILLLRLNFPEAYRIILEMVSYGISRSLLDGLLVFCAVSLLVSGYFVYNSRMQLKKRMLREILILVLLSLLFANALIIWGFAVYFVFWHSIPSIISQVDFMYGETSLNKILKYFKKSFVYWFISIAGLAVLFYFLKDGRDRLLSVILPFIAALTFPHALVISKMLWKTKAKTPAA